MSRKRAIIGAIVLSMVISVLTFTITNVVSLTMGDKVIVAKGDYQYLQGLNKSYKKLLGLRNYIETSYYKPTDQDKFEDGMIEGMFASLNDPYSVYMGKKEFEDFMVHTTGTYGGIGVIMTRANDGFITVVEPMQDSPGEKVGMKSGDKIVKVNDEEVTADKLDEAVAMIKGKPGTKVNLTIIREGKEEPFSLELKRENIRLKTVRSRVLDDGIGYIRISMFDELTAKDFNDHLKKLEKQNIKGLIIDLRYNPGGLLDQCVKIADKLLGKQVIVYTQDRSGERDYKRSDGKQVKYPYVLLVNEGSASASEILSGAVKDTKSGTLIGTTTFGKGLVQQVKSLNDGTGFKLTTAQYFTPNGTYIHGKGIEPNIVIEMPENLKNRIDLTDEEDVQLQKGIEVLQQKIFKE
ncbi:S41 family peptidase [Lutibacter sp. B2]|nr:S41 family peptidase [Lutibacter sp. B2]